MAHRPHIGAGSFAFRLSTSGSIERPHSRLPSLGMRMSTEAMLVRFVPRLLVLVMFAVAATTASAQSGAFYGRPGYVQSPLKDLVRARSRAIEAAFPGFLAISDFKLVIAPVTACPQRVTYLTCYDAVQNTLTFTREVLSAADSRLLDAAEDYWVFYEHAVLRDEFPIIGIIDHALWNAFMSEIAERYEITWPHADCGSIQLSKRLGCEMLVSGIESNLRFRHSRIYNANRLDRLWPDDLSSLEQSARPSRNREYAQVRDLGGTELLQPLIKEFGAARVFAYVAQTPFSIEENNVRVSALRYQELARSALGW